MPEQLTKFPDVTLEVLRSAGVKCGEGAPQEILTQCPVERFCKLPGGEICVFGLSESPRMTQLTPQDWQALVAANMRTPESLVIGPDALAAGGIGLIVGTLLALIFSRRRAKRMGGAA